MGWLFGRRPKVEDVFERIYQLMNSEQLQNDLLPSGLRQQIRWSQSVDEVTGGVGEFGFDERNPIPVNGPIGECFYLSALETLMGVPLAYQRVGSRNGIDIFETVTCDGREWATLFFDMYYPRKSRLAPVGYRLRELTTIRGSSSFCESFPKGIVARVVEESEKRLGIALASPELQKLEAMNLKRPADSFVWRWLDEAKKQRALKRAEIEQRIGLVSLETEDGSELPFEKWMTIQLAVIGVYAHDRVKSEWESLGYNLVPTYWRESLYLTISMLTTALFRLRFGGNPTVWSDRAIEAILPQTINGQERPATVQATSLSEAVLALRARTDEYRKCRFAFDDEPTFEDSAAFAARAGKNFCATGGRHPPASSLKQLTTIAQDLRKDIAVLAEAFAFEAHNSPNNGVVR